MTELPILTVEDASRTYHLSAGIWEKARSLKAVRNATLSLARGETLGIVGESGCGKSTLARLLLGLENPDSGRVLLEGRPVRDVPRLEFSARVQPVFQDPFSTLNPRRSVLDTVIHPLNVHKRGTSRERELRAAELLDLVGLPRRAHQSLPSQLSGGQRQRVAIARALALRPDVLICDEPTSALDVSIQAQILNLIRDLQAEFGIGIVFISHNLAVVEHVTDTVCVMYLGRIVERGRTADVMRSPQHPYTQALLTSVLTPDPRMGLPDLLLGATPPDPFSVPTGCGLAPRCAFARDLCRREPPAPRPVARSLAECHFAGELQGVATGT